MDLTALRTFQAVYATRSVSRAADMLNTVQSNVTARLRRLEEELDVALFHREPRGMAPTQAAEILADYAERLFNLADEARRSVAAVTEPRGPLRVGSLETASTIRLPSLLARYHRDHPRVALSLKTGSTAELVDAVLERRLDCAFASGPIQHRDLNVRPAYVEELVYVTEAARSGRPGQGNEALLVFRHGCYYRLVAEQWVRQHGITRCDLIEMGTVDAMLGCVAAGMGATLVPRTILEASPHRAALAAAALPPALGRVVTSIVWRRDAFTTGALGAFLDLVANEVDPARAA